VAGFRADPKPQARIEELAGKSTEGQLTGAEKAEYAGYVRANKFVAKHFATNRRLAPEHVGWEFLRLATGMD
jgi:hypothetical protein